LIDKDQDSRETARGLGPDFSWKVKTAIFLGVGRGRTGVRLALRKREVPTRYPQELVSVMLPFSFR